MCLETILSGYLPAFCLASTNDLIGLVRYLRSRKSECPVFAVGGSMGPSQQRYQIHHRKVSRISVPKRVISPNLPHHFPNEV